MTRGALEPGSQLAAPADRRATPLSTSCVRPASAGAARLGAVAILRACRAARRRATTSVSTADDECAVGRAQRRAGPRLAAGVLDDELGRVPLASAPRRRARPPRTRRPSRPSSSRRRGDAEARTRRIAAPARSSRLPAQSSGNQMPISRSADSSESEPCTRLKVTSVPKSPRIEPVVGLDRIGRADQLAGGLDRLDALEDHGDQRAAGDEVDELAEERLARCARRSARWRSPRRR